MIYLAICLGFAIVLCEWSRPTVRGGLDFRRFVSIIYFISFVVIPLYLYALDKLEIYIDSNLLHKNELSDPVFVYAELLAIIGYFCIHFGFALAASLTVRNRPHLSRRVGILNPSDCSEGYLVYGGSVLGVVGIAAFYFYLEDIGGLGNLLTYAAAIRAGKSHIQPQLGFLQNVAPIVLSASFFFYGAALSKSLRRYSRILFCIFILTFLVSLLVLYGKAGRLSLISYILIFPVSGMIRKNKGKFKLLMFGGVFVTTFIVFGKQIFHLLIDSNSVERKFDVLVNNPLDIISSILLEFVFPFVNLANVVQYIHLDGNPFRYLIDFYIAIVSLIVPQRIYNIDLPDTVSQINTRLFSMSGTIPIDLLSFGFFSIGIIGVIIFCLMFGAILMLFEKIFPVDGSAISLVFRVAWMFFLGFRVMYADPSMAVIQGFYLIVGTLVLFVSRSIFCGSSHYVADPVHHHRN